MKSNEDIKIENTEKYESVQKISVENIQNKFKKIKTFNIVLIILNILFIIGIGLLVFFLLKSKKQTNEKQHRKTGKQNAGLPGFSRKINDN